MRRALGVAALLALAGTLLWYPSTRRRAAPVGSETAVLQLLPGPGVEGFERAWRARPFTLPEDHGPHESFQTEWWYYTGQVSTANGRLFGFQLTFFRRGLRPGPTPLAGGLASHQIYFAHFALTDVASGRHHYHERFARGAAGLAGASATPFRVWLEDWSASATDAVGSALRLRARADDLELELDLRALKPLVLHGERGLSPKSDAPGNASYYIGYTRLAAQGRISLGGQTASVQGSAWFDHEWSTSALGPGAQGWDWFSLQLDDGRDVMFFRIRRADGTLERASGGTLVESAGDTRRLGRDDVQVEATETWTSPESGARYPIRWRLRGPDFALDVRARLAAQELRTSFTYWEGAVAVTGHSRGRAVTGQGYVELTGYARSMQGVF
jgi:predicted secreted hydrolase